MSTRDRQAVLLDHNSHVLILFKRGRTKIHVVAQSCHGVKVRRLDRNEMRHLRELQYPLRRAVRRFRAYGELVGITKAAKEALEGLQ